MVTDVKCISTICSCVWGSFALRLPWRQCLPCSGQLVTFNPSLASDIRGLFLGTQAADYSGPHRSTARKSTKFKLVLNDSEKILVPLFLHVSLPPFLSCPQCPFLPPDRSVLTGLQGLLDLPSSTLPSLFSSFSISLSAFCPSCLRI